MTGRIFSKREWEGSYCERSAEMLRTTPFLAGIPSVLCKDCWISKEYANSHREYIPYFDDYPHFETDLNSTEAKESR
ncbi:hypothetical protein D0469_02435 [Peribacillus saganii]|uniref:Uncharacterized protein n=1 Tax=Peribacillus saganii TaxID=2303992 RepID=A0A372LSR1_9BACI|nr:hypothetical protein D0469_02435 [Peribacillus saganii]